MSKFLFLFPLGVPVGTPTGFKFNPFVDAAVITGGASLLGNLLGFGGQSISNKNYLRGVQETNATNLQIAKETNEANRALYELQNRNNRANWDYQFNRESAYNSPAAQLARLRQAGINANDALSNGNSGGLQFGSAQPNPAVAAHMQAPDRVPSPFENMNLGSIAKDMLSSVQSAQQIQRSGIENYYAVREHVVDLMTRYEQLDQIKVKTANEREELRLLKSEIDFYLDTLPQKRASVDEELENLRKRNSLLDRQIIEEEHQTMRLDNETIQKIKSMSIDSAANYLNARSNANLSDAQVKNMVNTLSLNWKRLMVDAKRYEGELKIGSRNAKVNEDLRDFRKWFLKLDKQEKELAIQLSQIKLEQSDQKNSALLGKMLRYVLGVDLSDVTLFAPF